MRFVFRVYIHTQHDIGVKPRTLTHIRSMNSDNTASELEGSILDNRRLLDDSCALLDEVRRSRIPGPYSVHMSAHTVYTYAHTIHICGRRTVRALCQPLSSL